MKKALLYRASITVCGGALGLMGLSSIASGSGDLVSILLSIGGFGMVINTVYGTVLSSDSSGDVPSDRIIWVTTAMTLVVVIAGIWSIAA